MILDSYDLKAWLVEDDDCSGCLGSLTLVSAPSKPARSIRSGRFRSANNADPTTDNLRLHGVFWLVGLLAGA